MSSNSSNQQFQHADSSSQSIDCDSWVNSLGNIQDGIFQNTPITNSIINLNNTMHPQLQFFQQNPNAYNQPMLQVNQMNHMAQMNPQMNHQQQIQQQFQQQQQQFQLQQQQQFFQNTPLQSNTPFSINQDLNLDMNFNSPEGFYRDIINESPVVSRTPKVGRTPLRNLSINLSTPNFLKAIDNALANTSNSNLKSFSPYHNNMVNNNQQLQHSQNNPQSSSIDLELFQTPNLKIKKSKKNSAPNENDNLGSSPTTIKINSSVVRNEQNIDLDSKVIPASPTPISKPSNVQHQHQHHHHNQHHAQSVISVPIPDPTQATNINNKFDTGITMDANLSTTGNNNPNPMDQNDIFIPKMGCFKQGKEKNPPKASTSSNGHSSFSFNANANSKFQIIMTDVTSFANNNKSSRNKKKKLTRSATTSGASTFATASTSTSTTAANSTAGTNSTNSSTASSTSTPPNTLKQITKKPLKRSLSQPLKFSKDDNITQFIESKLLDDLNGKK